MNTLIRARRPRNGVSSVCTATKETGPCARITLRRIGIARGYGLVVILLYGLGCKDSRTCANECIVGDTDRKEARAEEESGCALLNRTLTGTSIEETYDYKEL